MSHHDHDHDHDHGHHHTHGHQHNKNHDHAHGHTQDQGHHHHHDHPHQHDQGNVQEPVKEMSFEEKLSTLFQHWIAHNASHKQTYESWAQKAEKENLAETAALLKEIADISNQITEKLEKALGLTQK